MFIRLGDYLENAPPKTTPGGIVYYPHGLDDYAAKRVRKAVKKLVAAGVAEYVIADLRQWALKLPTELPAWIDKAYQARMFDWRECVGGRLPNGERISASTLEKVTPGSFRIIFHPDAFTAPQGVLAAGMAFSDRIEVAIVALTDGGTWLRKADALCEFELGNLIARRHGYSPRDSKDDIGNRRPC